MMLNPAGHSHNPQDPDSLLFVSFLILGLDPVALEHKLKTPVNQKCFTRINRRLGDTLLHFLFVCLDGEKAGKAFRNCWPLLDKKHESQFYKAAFEWYKTLQQSYKQPVPTVMAKTFMTPGGPKFTSTLMTLARTALHTLAIKTDPSCTLLNTPSHSRNPEQNTQTLRMVKAFKVAHTQNYIVQQKVRQCVLVTLKDKARDLCSKYRGLCKEGERAAWEFTNTLNNNERLLQHQKDIFASASPATIRKALLPEITRMNECVAKLWMKVDQYQQVEESAWKVLCPLLDGSTSFSHINGSVYSPQVPDMVYKTHANAINKLKLQGLYHEGKLDLLSLVQYSSLALTSLLDAARTTHNHNHAESHDQIKAQSGQVTSLDETVSQLSDKINGLLPAINRSASSNTLSTSCVERTGSAGKPQLCPPAPPFTLFNKTEASMTTSHIPLQLTPVVQKFPARFSSAGFAATPRRLLCDMGIINASKVSEACDLSPDVHCNEDSVQWQRKREPDLPSDSHSTLKKLKGTSGISKDVVGQIDISQDVYMTKTLEKMDISKDFLRHNLQADSKQCAIKIEDRHTKVMPPTNTDEMQIFPQSGQPAKVQDIAMTPKLSGSSKMVEGSTGSICENIFTNLEKLVDISPLNGQQPPSTQQEKEVFSLKCEMKIKDLKKRYQSSNLDELQHQSKGRSNFLFELQEPQQKPAHFLNRENPQDTKSKPSFISYVETLKKSRQSSLSEKKSIKTEKNIKLKTSNITNMESVVPDKLSIDKLTENVSVEDYYETFTRMQSLLDIDDTLTANESKNDKECLAQDEVFVSGKDAGHHFETERSRPSLLPVASVFDTLTDSILCGELDVSLLTDENVGKQIRRESVSSHQQSIANLRRLSLESSRNPSDASFGLDDCSGILDEIDCSLLTTSMEDA